MLEDLNEEQVQALSRIRNLESDLINIKETARQTDKLQNAFIANINHEIRTPMNAIVGLTSLLNDREISRAETADYIETIHSSCKQLLTVIDDIVDISKIESGHLTIRVEEVNLNDILRDLYAIYRNQGKLKNIDLTYSAGLTDDHSQIRTDRSRISQVFRNLLNNAFMFTETGNIEFGYFPDEGKITFYVKDDGIGIRPEYQSLIFNRFWQAESSISRSHGGLGLGLSISKKIVEAMGGTI
ncbi:MAG: ATP-binding protein, partial [Bacteroidales bacterium]